MDLMAAMARDWGEDEEDDAVVVAVGWEGPSVVEEGEVLCAEYAGGLSESGSEERVRMWSRMSMVLGMLRAARISRNIWF